MKRNENDDVERSVENTLNKTFKQLNNNPSVQRSTFNIKKNVLTSVDTNLKIKNTFKKTLKELIPFSPRIYSDEDVLKSNGFQNVIVCVQISKLKVFLKGFTTQDLLSLNKPIKNLSKNVYEVEKILQILKVNNKTEYLIKWKGYPYRDSSWEKDVSQCKELLEEFKKRIRLLNIIGNEFKCIQKFFYIRHKSPSFFLCQQWEDELCEVTLENGQGPIYVENWNNQYVRLKTFTFIIKNQISNEVKSLFDNAGYSNYCKCKKNDCGSKIDCCPDTFGMKFQYTSSGRLRKTFDFTKEWLIECSDSCDCGTDCATRVVQRGRQIPIVLFRTLDRGWSVRTMVSIEPNTFVMEYVGVVITLEKAQKGLATYQFEMDACDDKAFVVDALNFGNEARFVNHSCDPNLFVRGVFSDRFDKRYHRIAYFSSRFIKRGEEITINYFSKLSDSEYKKLTKNRSRKSCFCKSSNCRGFII